MWRVTAVILSAALARQTAADVLPIPGELDERIRTAVYREDEVYRLNGRIGFELDLEFAPEERFVGLATGDVEGVAFEAQANHLFLKPRAAQVVTNLTVLTNRHHYHLDYQVVAPKASVAGVDSETAPIYALRFTYPDEARTAETLRAARLAAEHAVDEAFKTQRPVVNRDYLYCGPPTLKPESVTDDGVRTTFRFPAHSELPAIFVRAADGGETIVNSSIIDDNVVVHRLSPGFVLRRGRLVACIVNRGYEGSGDRLASGTVLPAVERVLPRAPDSQGVAR